MSTDALLGMLIHVLFVPRKPVLVISFERPTKHYVLGQLFYSNLKLTHMRCRWFPMQGIGSEGGAPPEVNTSHVRQDSKETANRRRY